MKSLAERWARASRPSPHGCSALKLTLVPSRLPRASRLPLTAAPGKRVGGSPHRLPYAAGLLPPCAAGEGAVRGRGVGKGAWSRSRRFGPLRGKWRRCPEGRPSRRAGRAAVSGIALTCGDTPRAAGVRGEGGLPRKADQHGCFGRTVVMLRGTAESSP